MGNEPKECVIKNSKAKDFKYPPILPIVYYEGNKRWTAERNFKNRTYLSDTLGKYIRDFKNLKEYVICQTIDAFRKQSKI